MAIPPTRQVVQVLRYPEGMPREGDFGLDRRPLDAPGAGEVVVRNHWLSLDPYLRPLLGGRYATPRPVPGATFPGGALGQVVHSNSDRPVIAARATLQGLVVFDHLDRFDEFTNEVAPLVRDGSVQYRESVSEGLAAAPAAFIAMMSGRNSGKSLVRLAP